MAPQDANRYLEVPTSRFGDFQEENRDSPLEWLSTSLAWASHVIEYTARCKFEYFISSNASGICRLLEHILANFASLYMRVFAKPNTAVALRIALCKT